jgi:NitT/TauT family transport system substrate-binding protein
VAALALRRISRRKSLIVTLGVVLAGRRAQAQESAPIRIAGPPLDAYKGAQYAARSGLFKRYGLNVEPTIMQSGSAAMAALSGGSIELAFTSLLPVIQAYLRGLPLQIVASSGWYISEAPQLELLVRKDSPIRTGRDLNNKIVASASLRDLNAVAALAWVDQNGGDSKTVRLVEIPTPALLAALDQGRIDAATFGSPFIEQAIASGKARVLAKSYDAISKRFQVAGYIGTVDYISKNTDAMRRFARAMHDAAVYTNAHLPDTVELVASYSGVDASTIAKSIRATDPEYTDPRNIQPLIDVAAKYGIIERAFPADEIISAAALRPPR